MQLFFDIDGVLLNFEQAFVRFLNRVYGMGLPERYETRTWFFEDLMTREEIHERWQAFMDAEDSARMAPLVAPERFNDLARSHGVHLLTNFPEPYRGKREQNLAALGFGYHTLDFCGLHPYNGAVPPSKAEVVERLRVRGEAGMFVDDHPENCLDVLSNCGGVEVWVMSRQFNREFDHPQVRRAENWQCLFDRLEREPANCLGAGRLCPAPLAGAS